MKKTPTKRRTPPAFTSDTAERLCIDSAYNLAQKQLEEGTASPSVIVHFLKMGTAQAELERAKLEKETELLSARKIAIEEGEKTKDLIEEAMKAFKSYNGISSDDDDEEDYYDEDDDYDDY